VEQIEQHWVFAGFCAAVMVLLVRLIVRERVTLQSSLAFLWLLVAMLVVAIYPQGAFWLAARMGFALPSNFLFAMGIGALALINIATLVTLSRVELRSRLYGDLYDYSQHLHSSAAEDCQPGQVNGCTRDALGLSRWADLMRIYAKKADLVVDADEKNSMMNILQAGQAGHDAFEIRRQRIQLGRVRSVHREIVAALGHAAAHANRLRDGRKYTQAGEHIQFRAQPVDHVLNRGHALPSRLGVDHDAAGRARRSEETAAGGSVETLDVRVLHHDGRHRLQ